MQLFFALVALCVCARCFECGVQGQLRECGYGMESCYDLDMRVRVDPKRPLPSAPEPSPRDGYEPWPRNYERWQLGASEQARDPALSEQRKRARSPRMTNPRTSWQVWNTR